MGEAALDVEFDKTVAPPPDKRIPGEPGLWVFLLGDMVIFAVMFVAFLIERAADEELFRSSRESVDLTVALVNTMILLISSLLVVVALNSARARRFANAAALVGGALICALAFVALKSTEYAHLIDVGHGPSSNPYFLWLFILTGIHLSHVVIGFLALGIFFANARREKSADGERRVFYEGAACYWHLVDLLWMVLFPLVYLVA
ncbi:MAG: cytochrome c oxidase subunit 3 [Gordonia sp. (in: high G+C Gram-positive bacteria)]